ncbi:hypothetical protein H072_11340 [Dactylellina haptotyla CBS 200.50]|uniref:Uncharacterized protein n=1 Tax=Dactylellina haptotyla (strain CBS 200.50) TaxID=1284197 RepID=S8B8E5_DACHA|nr:hypothetical protein H072_11340 [Dactylellina haptotyla CBS 200.50]
MPRRRTDHPTSPPQHSKNSHRRQQSQPHNSSGPSLQQLHAVHDAPASLEQLNALNFPVLQRFVPALQRIVLTTSYCTAYKIANGNWEKLDIEGPLFLLELNPYHPQFFIPGMNPKMIPGMGRFHAFVMNRKGVSNLLIPLPKQSENIDTTNSVLISMLMEWEDCYGLSVFDQEGTSTASESERVGAQVLELVKEMETDDARLVQMIKQQQHMNVQAFGGYAMPPPPPPQQQAPMPVPMPMPLQTPTGYSGSPSFMTPTAENSGIDLMAALGPKLGIMGGGNASGYTSGDGGYTSGASGSVAKGRKISLNELFGKQLG